jgi:hypothetical protein
MIEEGVMKYTVTFEFTGEGAENAVERFYHWSVDGGLQDEIEQNMEEQGCPVYMVSIDNEKRVMTFKTGEEQVKEV